MSPIEHAAIEIVNEAHARGFCGLSLQFAEDILRRVAAGTYEVPKVLGSLAFEISKMEPEPEPTNLSNIELEVQASEEIDNGLAKTQGNFKPFPETLPRPGKGSYRGKRMGSK